MNLKSIQRDLSRRRFWLRFGNQTLVAVGVLATFFELYDVFAPNALGKSKAPWGWVIAALSLAFGLYRAWPRPVEQRYTRPHTEIRIRPGDLFEQDANLVIGMTTTFDTAIPNIVAENSVQGQLLTRAYDHDLVELDKDIADALVGVPVEQVIEKEGKTDAYPMGTVAVLKHGRKLHYLLAYTAMSEQNEARTTVANVWHCLDRLWESVRATSNGDAIAIPVIGGGQSKLSNVLPAHDAVRLMAMSYMFASRHERVCERLDIIVLPQDEVDLDMPELQAFLASMADS